MNIFKWLKDKAGKLPVSVAQAAGITAVVGAAGLAALSYLGGSSENNNTFIPPSAYEEPGEVVYISQNTGGNNSQYELNGEMGSSFRAAPSRSIQLANQQEERAQQTRALENASSQPVSSAEEDGNVGMPKAYQMAGTDLGKGLGGGKNKDTNMLLDNFSNIKSQISGLADVVNQAQADAQQTQPQAAAGKPTTPTAPGSGFSRASSRSWSNSTARGAGVIGGGSGSPNTFVVQDSGKGAQGISQAGATGEVKDALSQAQAAMQAMSGSHEGTRLQATSRFGDADGLGQDRNSRIGRGNRFGGEGGPELERIRKHTAQIASNKTNSANEAGRPFLSSAKISGGITVSDGESVTTGQGITSSDLSGARGGGSNFDNSIGNLQNKMDDLTSTFDEQKLARDTLKSWMLTMAAIAVAAMVAVSILVNLAKHTPWPWNVVLYAAAGILTVAALIYIWAGAIKQIGNYNDVCGADKWSTFGWILSGIMTGGLGLAWLVGPKLVPTSISKTTSVALGILGFGAVGYGLSDIMKSDDAEAEETKKDINDTTEKGKKSGEGN